MGISPDRTHNKVNEQCIYILILEKIQSLFFENKQIKVFFKNYILKFLIEDFQRIHFL